MESSRDAAWAQIIVRRGVAPVALFAEGRSAHLRCWQIVCIDSLARDEASSTVAAADSDRGVLGGLAGAPPVLVLVLPRGQDAVAAVRAPEKRAIAERN